MELKRRFDFRKIVTTLYIGAFLVYLAAGLIPAEAKHYEISGRLSIPAIGLNSDVTTLELVDHKLETPDTIVGSYNKYSSKTFLIGHSSTVFKNLKYAKVGGLVYYNNAEYEIIKMETLLKTDVNMNALLSPTLNDTIVIMTCAGESVGEKDATHRLIVTALKK